MCVCVCTWVARSRSKSTSQFTALALNKPSSSSSSFTALALNKLSPSSSSNSSTRARYGQRRRHDGVVGGAAAAGVRGARPGRGLHLFPWLNCAVCVIRGFLQGQLAASPAAGSRQLIEPISIGSVSPVAAGPAMIFVCGSCAGVQPLLYRPAERYCVCARCRLFALSVCAQFRLLVYDLNLTGVVALPTSTLGLQLGRQHHINNEASRHAREPYTLAMGLR